jgi:hypothetical protein
MADKPTKLGYIASAASFAYWLDQYKNLRLTPSECDNINDIINLVLVIEYEKDYLYLHLVEVDPEWELFPPVSNRFAKEFGEKSGNTLQDVGCTLNLGY